MEVKDILNLIDVPESIATVDELKVHLAKNYIHRNVIKEDADVKGLINSEVGRVMGSTTTAALRIFGLDKSAAEGKKLDEVLQLGVENFNTKISELEKAKGDPTKEVEQWKGKFEAARKDAETWQTTLQTKENEWNEKESGFANQIKTGKLGYVLTAAKSEVRWKDDLTDIEREGFDSYINKGYEFDFDESETPVVIDKKTKEKVKNSKGTGFATPKEFYEIKAYEQNLVKKNNGGSPKPIGRINNNQGNNGAPVYEPAKRLTVNVK